MANLRMPELDALRFCAAISVVFYHYTYREVVADAVAVQLFPGFAPVTQFGYLGVNLFFIISGFVIVWSAWGKRPLAFLYARALRLYPTFWAACLITLVVMFTFSPVFSFGAVDVLKNMTMLAGYLGADYVDGVYWTLQLELKFYFLVLLLIATRQIQNIEIWLLAWLALIAFCFFVPGYGVLRSIAISPYGVYFIAGGMFFVIRQQGLTVRRLLVVLACLALAAAGSVSEARGFLSPPIDQLGYTSAGIVAACFILFFIITMGWLHLPGKRICTYLGALTYPLYLIHNTAGKLVFDSISPYVGKYSALALTLIWALMLSFVLVKLVEQGLTRQIGRLLERRMQRPLPAAP